jgi:DNA-directed RNA polymerase subunit H (RpoH/RPB5)
MEDFVKIYYGARGTCLQMFKDRGYLVPEVLDQVTQSEFDVMFEKKNMDISGVVDNSDGVDRPVYVKIVEPTKQFNKEADRKSVYKDVSDYFERIGHPTISDYKSLNEALEDGEIRLIVIYNSRQSGQVQNKYEKDAIPHSYLEVFQVHMMNINPTQNRYQPKFRLITDQAEITNIYRRYDAKPTVLGSICLDDPITRYYNAKPAASDRLAHVFEINRGGTNIYYRKVTTKRMNIK